MGNQIHPISWGVINIVYIILAPCMTNFYFLEYCGLGGLDVSNLARYIIPNICDCPLAVFTVTGEMSIPSDNDVCFCHMLSFL